MSLLRVWASRRVSQTLGFEADDITSHILAINDHGDLIEFCQSVLGEDEGLKFAQEIKQRRESDNVQVYSKPKEAPVFFVGNNSKGSSGGGKKGKQKGAQPDSLSAGAQSFVPSSSKGNDSNNTDKNKKENTKKQNEHSANNTNNVKNNKNENLIKGQKNLKGKHSLPPNAKPVFMHPGRAPGQKWCECQARRHKLLGNCLACGRVVCEYEGSGPCVFCGTFLVGATPEEEREFSRKAKAGLLHSTGGNNNNNSNNNNNNNKKNKKYNGKSDSEIEARGNDNDENDDDAAMKRAIAHKNKLIEFERDRAKRTAVYDDQMDYFPSDSKWLSPEEREAALERERQEAEAKEQSKRGGVSVTFDFTGKQIISDADEERKRNAEALRRAQGLDDIDSNSNLPYSSSSSHDPAAAGLPCSAYNPCAAERPEFTASDSFFASLNCEDDGDSKGSKPKGSTDHLPRRRMRRVQHEDDLSRPVTHTGDLGLCLSMHQPWASLLVSGIKRVEGRTWSTGHRGRLWIASTSQEPDEELIEGMEEAYIEQWGSRGELDDMPPFPVHYPVGALLGFVDVADVKPNEEYDGALEETESPCVFVCENPRDLLVPIRVSGSHKIWKLSKETLTQAQRAMDIQQ